MNEIFHLPQALGRGGDVLIAAGRALGQGDGDVATPARGWRGDVFIELPSFHRRVAAVHFRKSGAVRSAFMPRCFAAAATCCRYIAKAPNVLNAGRP